jgi:hypothetical protein
MNMIRNRSKIDGLGLVATLLTLAGLGILLFKTAEIVQLHLRGQAIGLANYLTIGMGLILVAATLILAHTLHIVLEETPITPEYLPTGERIFEVKDLPNGRYKITVAEECKGEEHKGKVYYRTVAHDGKEYLIRSAHPLPPLEHSFFDRQPHEEEKEFFRVVDGRAYPLYGGLVIT